MSYKEKLFEQVDKQLTFYVKILKYSLLPLTIIVVGIGTWWGFDIKNARQEIIAYKDSLDLKTKKAELATEDYQISSREVDMLQKEFRTKISETKKELENVIDEYQDLKQKNEKALKKTNELYNSLVQNNKTLTGVSKEVELLLIDAKNELTSIQDEYYSEIEIAKAGVDEKIKMSQEIQQAIQNQYDKVIKVTELLKKALEFEAELHYVPDSRGRPNNEIKSDQQTIFDAIDKLLESDK